LIQRYSQVATTTIFKLVCGYKYSKGGEGLLTSGNYLNKGVIVLDAADIGHVIRETTDKIIVFEKNEARYDIPIHEVQQVGANVLIGLHLSDIEDRYKVERKEPLPLAEMNRGIMDVDNREHKEDYTSTKENESNEEFYKYYHGPKDELNQIQSKGQSRRLFDLHTLLTQRQDRLWQALEERYQYNTSLKRSQDFLLKHVTYKVPLVIIFADLVGSTQLSMNLPVDKLVIIITAFSREISSV